LSNNFGEWCQVCAVPFNGGAGYLPFGKVLFQSTVVPLASLPWQDTQFLNGMGER
jgi:hypothetical protein